MVEAKQGTFEKYVRGKFRDWSPKIDAMHDYLIGQEAVAKDKANRPSAGVPISEIVKVVLGIISVIGVIGSAIILTRGPQ